MRRRMAEEDQRPLEQRVYLSSLLPISRCLQAVLRQMHPQPHFCSFDELPSSCTLWHRPCTYCHGSFSEGSLLTAADIRSGCRKAIGFGATSPPPEVWVPIVRSCVLRRSASTVQSWQAWHFEEHVVIGVFGVRRTCGHCSMDLRDGDVPNCRQQEWVCLERVIWLV